MNFRNWKPAEQHFSELDWVLTTRAQVEGVLLYRAAYPPVMRYPSGLHIPPGPAKVNQ